MQGPPGSVMLVPEAGFCFKGQRERWIEAGGKVFVNVCAHPRIDPVCGANMEATSEEHLDTWGLGNMRVPLLVGPTREMKDSEGHDATAVDVIFHPAVVRRAITGGKSVTKEHFRDYLMDIAVKNIREDHDIKLAAGRTAALGNARYKGPRGENSDNTHAFPVFPPGGVDGGEGGAGGQEEDDVAAQMMRMMGGAGGGGGGGAPQTRTKQPSDAAHRSPLIQEIGGGGGGGGGERRREDDDDDDDKSGDGGGKKGSSFSFGGGGGKKKKPIKKGFLGAAGAAAELYPDGSAEGIPKPGEQYDPLGHIPESVRSKCHVIDSGALQGADLEAVTQEYAKTGRLDTSKPGVYVKGSKPGDQKPGDVGIGHPTNKKAAPAGRGGGGGGDSSSSTRDQGESSSSSSSSSSNSGAGGGASGGGDGGGGGGGTRDDAREVPEHEVSGDATLGGESAVEVRVKLPLLKGGMAAVDLDVGPTTLSVQSAEYNLTVPLPHAVDVDAAQAKFSSKRMELKVTAPTVSVAAAS